MKKTRSRICRIAFAFITSIAIEVGLIYVIANPNICYKIGEIEGVLQFGYLKIPFMFAALAIAIGVLESVICIPKIVRGERKNII